MEESSVVCYLCGIVVIFIIAIMDAMRIQEDGRYFLKVAAATQGAIAQYNAGWCYADGYGVQNDHQLARHYYALSSSQQLPEGPAALGELLIFKFNMPDEGVRLVRLAMAQGETDNILYARALFVLGQCHRSGLGGVTKDSFEAMMLYEKAAAKGCSEARKALEKMDKAVW